MCVKLFEAVVTPCVLYVCGTWTMTAACEQVLRTTRRKMLRWMVRIARKRDEDWVEYIWRAIHQTERLAADHAAVDWVDVQRQRKWKLARKTARHSDSRWSTRLLYWQPWFRMSPKRKVGRPKKLWDDDLAQLAGGAWPHEAKDATFWKTSETGYVDRCR